MHRERGPGPQSKNRTFKQKNMHRYQVFKHPASGDTEAIPEGWNWAAFLFGPLWALFHSMWAVGVGLLIGGFVLACVAIEVVGPGAEVLMNIVMIATALILASNGNAWRADQQRKQGYEWIEVVVAASPEAALAMVFPNADPDPRDDGTPQA